MHTWLSEILNEQSTPLLGA